MNGSSPQSNPKPSVWPGAFLWIAIFLVYSVTFILLYGRIGEYAFGLTFLPAVLIAGARGLPAGTLGSAALTILNFLLLLLAGEMFVQGMFTSIFWLSHLWIFFAAAIAGYLHTSTIRSGPQARENIRLHESLFESQERYRMLVDSSPDAIIVHREGKIVFVNPAGIKLMGASRPEDLLGLPILDLVHADDRPAVLERIKQVIEKHRAVDIREERLLRLDGKTIFVEVISAPIHYAGEHAALVIVRDISERKSRHLDLAESEYRFRTLFDQSLDSVVIVDLQGYVLNANPSAGQLLGYHPDEMVAMHASEIAAPEERAGTQRVLEKMLSGETLPLYERIIVRKDGIRVPIEVRVALIVDPTGKPLFIQSVSRDISERKLAEKQLKHMATHDQLTNLPNRVLFFERLDGLLNQARRELRPISIMFLDLDGFKWVNDTFGHPKGDLLLHAIGQRLERCLNEKESIARMGGDEFTVVLENLADQEEIGEVAARILASLAEPFPLDGNLVTITGSIGISTFPRDAESAEILLKQADNAMYRAKAHGKNCYAFYHETVVRRDADLVSK